jgi:putative ABC transport system permease protein
VSLLRRALWRDLRARRAQFLAVAATMVLGVGLFGASYDAFQNLTSSYQGLYERLDFADLTAVGGSPDAVAAALGSVSGVEATAVRTVGDTPIRIGDRKLVGRIVGMPLGAEPAVDRILLLRGSGLDAANPDGVVADQHLADYFGLAAGDRISILTAAGWREVTVVGVAASAEYLWPAPSRQQLFVNPGDFGVLFAAEELAAGLPAGQAHPEALARLAPTAPDGALAAARVAAVDAGAISTLSQAEQASNAALQEDVAGFGELSLMFPLLFLGAGALATYVLLARLVASQRAQIGVLLASGFSRRQVLGHYLGFGLLVGLAGSIPGAILGGLSAAAITSLYTAAISVPLTVVEVRPLTILVGLAMGPIAGALAALGPARTAARLSPAAAMGGNVPVGSGRQSILERLLPPLRRLPVRWLVSVRGLGRNRRRSASTVIGIALATSLVVVAWGMLDTTVRIVERQFRTIQRQDAQVYLAAPLPADQAVAALQVAGVATAEPVLESGASVSHGEHRYATTIVGFQPGTGMHTFIDSGGTRLTVPTDALLLGAALRDVLHVQAGDVVTVQLAADGSAGPTRTATLPVRGFVDEPMGSFAYTSLDRLATIAGGEQATADPAVTTVYLRFDPGVDRGAMRARISDLPGVAAYADSQALYEIAQSFLGLFYAFIGVMLAFGAVMAFALIFNTLTANVAERSVELAVLRTQGMGRATLGRLVTVENLLLTLIGLAVGLAGGYALAVVFMATFSSDLFSFRADIAPLTFVATAIAIIAVALLSQAPAIRAIGRLDLGRVVRERAT